MTRLGTINEIIDRHLGAGRRLSITAQDNLAQEIESMMKRSAGGSASWGIYTHKDGVLEPIKIGFGSKTAARDHWLTANGLDKEYTRVHGTAVGYVYVDLTGKASPVTVCEEKKAEAHQPFAG